jgi:hypothetical protein
MNPSAAALAILLAAAPLAACASTAAPPSPGPLVPPAEDAAGPSFGREGLYFGVYALHAYEDFDVSGSNVSTGDSDLGAGLRVGYRATDHLAFEVFGESVDGFEVESGNIESDLDLAQFGFLGKLYVIADGRLQPYLVAGGGIARSDVDDFDLDDDGGFVRAGIGTDLYITRNFALFGEVNYNEMVGDTGDLDHIDAMLGLLFRF